MQFDAHCAPLLWFPFGLWGEQCLAWLASPSRSLGSNALPSISEHTGTKIRNKKLFGIHMSSVQGLLSSCRNNFRFLNLFHALFFLLQSPPLECASQCCLTSDLNVRAASPLPCRCHLPLLTFACHPAWGSPAPEGPLWAGV